jgi:competence protein ComEC
VNEIVSLLLASLIAGLATTPYAAYHFHRLAPYGVIANLLAMPVVSAWVMPMGILDVIAIPFGFDALFWRQMGYGIEWMDTVALWVASLPGAFGRVTSFGTGPLLLATAGLLVIGLLKTPLRWSGAAFVVLALVLAARTPVPDVLVAADGRTFAVRGANGKLAFHRTGSDTFGDARMARLRRRRPRCQRQRSRRRHRLFRSAVSASSPMAAPCPMPSRPTPSKRIAAAPPLS